MARTTTKRTRDGFDVTYEKVIGRVSFDGNGQDSPKEAAFKLIADYSDDGGTFRFPLNDEGHVCIVNVDYEGGPQPAEAEAVEDYGR